MINDLQQFIKRNIKYKTQRIHKIASRLNYISTRKFGPYIIISHLKPNRYKYNNDNIPVNLAYEYNYKLEKKWTDILTPELRDKFNLSIGFNNLRRLRSYF